MEDNKVKDKCINCVHFGPDGRGGCMCTVDWTPKGAVANDEACDKFKLRIKI